MIGWGDVCKVVVAMVPLYVALGLGYGSVKWWGMFKADECDAINRFTCYFILPFFTFHFTAGVNPYAMNFRFLGGDVVAKAMAGVALAAWAKYGGGDLSWAITTFSLSCFNNTLVVGVPLLRAMYGEVGEDLVVQSSVIQALLWFPILLFLLEFWRATDDDSSIEIPAAAHVSSASDNSSMPSLTLSSSSNLGATMKKVGAKLGKNPNCYASALGLIWALLANRWNFKMPSILEGSILIMAKAGSGVSMFTIVNSLWHAARLLRYGLEVCGRTHNYSSWISGSWLALQHTFYCYSSGGSARSNIGLCFRSRVRLARKRSQHCGHIWNNCIPSSLDCVLYRIRSNSPLIIS
ncbi:hypothetical protein ACS0TY_005089 [Phlomoides rotata]